MSEKKDPILEEETFITLDGKQYTMKRLSVRDVLKFSKIVNQALSGVDVSALLANDGQEEATNAMGMAFLTELVESGDKFAGFYGSVIGLNAEQFLALPAEALGELLEELPKHQDMQAFFAATARYLAAMGSLWQNV